MTSRALLTATVLLIAPVGIATWILATYTVGMALSPGNPALVGFAVALLAVAVAVWLLFLGPSSERPGSHLGLALVLGGVVCILAALALQFYIASVTAENSRRAAEILGERLRPGQSANFNLNADYPGSVPAIAYLTLFAGVWLAAVGIRVGMAHGSSVPQVPTDFAPTPARYGAPGAATGIWAGEQEGARPPIGPG